MLAEILQLSFQQITGLDFHYGVYRLTSLNSNPSHIHIGIGLYLSSSMVKILLRYREELSSISPDSLNLRRLGVYLFSRNLSSTHHTFLSRVIHNVYNRLRSYPLLFYLIYNNPVVFRNQIRSSVIKEVLSSGRFVDLDFWILSKIKIECDEFDIVQRSIVYHLRNLTMSLKRYKLIHHVSSYGQEFEISNHVAIVHHDPPNKPQILDSHLKMDHFSNQVNSDLNLLATLIHDLANISTLTYYISSSRTSTLIEDVRRSLSNLKLPLERLYIQRKCCDHINLVSLNMTISVMIHLISMIGMISILILTWMFSLSENHFQTRGLEGLLIFYLVMTGVYWCIKEYDLETLARSNQEKVRGILLDGFRDFDR